LKIARHWNQEPRWYLKNFLGVDVDDEELTVWLWADYRLDHDDPKKVEKRLKGGGRDKRSEFERRMAVLRQAVEIARNGDG
jgi:hypothetical protein